MRKPLLAVLLLCAVVAAQAQQLYRWTDDKGRVHITDTPPPASAKDVQKKQAVAGGSDAGQQPFELAVAMKEFPVVLYTSPSCERPCASARDALNRRAVPFREIQVWNQETNAELRSVSGASEVPTLLVGRSVQRGFEQGAYDSLLDSARYPRAGLLPPRTQGAPPPPAGYSPPGAQAQASKPAAAKPAAEEPAPRGPYAPGAPPQRATQQPAQKK